MKRYICGAKDHWADILDRRFGVTQESRANVTLMGDNKLLELAKPKLRCLREYIEAFEILTKKFPTDSSTCDNSWFRQPAFETSNILTEINRRNRTGYPINSFKQENFNLPTTFHCRLSELYMGGRFIQIDALQDLVRERTGNAETEVTETTLLAL